MNTCAGARAPWARNIYILTMCVSNCRATSKWRYVKQSTFVQLISLSEKRTLIFRSFLVFKIKNESIKKGTICKSVHNLVRRTFPALSSETSAVGALRNGCFTDHQEPVITLLSRHSWVTGFEKAPDADQNALSFQKDMHCAKNYNKSSVKSRAWKKRQHPLFKTHDIVLICRGFLNNDLVRDLYFYSELRHSNGRMLTPKDQETSNRVSKKWMSIGTFTAFGPVWPGYKCGRASNGISWSWPRDCHDLLDER